MTDSGLAAWGPQQRSLTTKCVSSVLLGSQPHKVGRKRDRLWQIANNGNLDPTKARLLVLVEQNVSSHQIHRYLEKCPYVLRSVCGDRT